MSKLVTKGFGTTQLIITRGFGTGIIAKILESQAAARTFLHRTITAIRFDIEHVDPKFTLSFIIGRFAPLRLPVGFDISRIPKAIFNINIKRFTIDVANRLNSIITGSKSIKIITGEDDKSIS